ncbi:hypothetical protein RFI_17520 [Reticulomyxa filosa]|uniref:Inositol polyphosphate-related phosphatase domain-containing protein n=1 Tax=Reticulomyxa filosa TaxID=46433 RepID=X6N1U2_RETFI|nr:hypothetical protein RFI_17520 [Reticulomyxa filosa]|eukprot:ETO19709.1 hypothetical protein RFI_17520 [Reticulomyxa filosa]
MKTTMDDTIISMQTSLVEEDEENDGEEESHRVFKSGRMYIMIYYEKATVFGTSTLSDADIQLRRTEKLKLLPEIEPSLPIRLYLATYNCGMYVCVCVDVHSKKKKNYSLSRLYVYVYPSKKKKKKGNAPLKSLFDWLPLSDEIDMYVLGFQECKPHNRKDKDTQKEKDTEEKELEEKAVETASNQRQIEAILSAHLGESYVSLANCNMWQIRLFIFVKQIHESKVSGITMHHQPTGVGGVGKNKGGVAVSFDFEGVSMCFVSSHLAAHFSKVQNRNNDYKHLCKGLRFCCFF